MFKGKDLNMPDSVSVLYFSPAGMTEKTAKRLAAGLSADVKPFDLTARDLTPHAFAHDDFAVFAVPVFMGRVPVPAIKAVKMFRGNQTPVVSVVVYGARAFEDALIELNDTLGAQGFDVAASGSFIARHSMAGQFAAGRPDADDFNDIDCFAADILKKIETAQGAKLVVPQVPGNRPYRSVPSSVLAPLTDEKACIRCGLCAKKCPVQAISSDNPSVTVAEKCFMCTRCLHICPLQARSLPPPVKAHVTELLSKTIRGRTRNETYL